MGWQYSKHVLEYVLISIRYSFFTFLYPIGVLVGVSSWAVWSHQLCPVSLHTQGEQLLMFKSLPVVRATGQWSVALPNKFNISYSFYYQLWFTILLYIPRESFHRL